MARTERHPKTHRDSSRSEARDTKRKLRKSAKSACRESPHVDDYDREWDDE